MIGLRLSVLLLATAVVGGCTAATGTDGDVAQVRGTWQYVGTQSVPALALTGTLVLSTQDGEAVSGTLTWVEDDGVGGVRQEAAAITGRVLSVEDIDFDVLADGGARRHVARINRDQMEGAWVQVQTGRSGTFTATRQSP